MKALLLIFLLSFEIHLSAQVNNSPGPENGSNEKASDRIDQYINGLVNSNNIGGAVVLASKDDSVFQFHSYGWCDKEKKIPMPGNAIFWLASMTKPFVVASIFILKDEGQLSIDDPVSKYIPEINDMKVGIEYTDSTDGERRLKLENVKHAMTIRHLLANTSGFISAGLYDGPIADQYKLASYWKYKDLQQMVLAHVKIPLVNQPGEAWGYDFSYNVLALIIEKVSGKSLEKFFKEKIFEPLGMKDTGFNLKKKDWSRVSQYYYTENGKLSQQQPDVLEKVSLFQGNSGCWSTAEDYYKFCEMILHHGTFMGNTIIQKTTIDELFSDVEIGKDGNLLSWLPGYGYGMGFAIRVDNGKCNFAGSRGELCWFGVLNTSFWIDPGERIICIALTHIVPSDGNAISKELRNIIYSKEDK